MKVQVRSYGKGFKEPRFASALTVTRDGSPVALKALHPRQSHLKQYDRKLTCPLVSYLCPTGSGVIDKYELKNALTSLGMIPGNSGPSLI